jgi:outer membrane murein-binding lipoprotein Lpp
MRNVALTTGALAAAVLAVAGAASAAKTSLVPSFVQSLIAKRSPLLAYVPTRIAAPSFKYAGYQASTTRVSETFAQTPKRKIVFSAIAYSAPCADGRQRSFQLSGNKVYWAQLDNTQMAWRCVTGRDGRQLRLAASSALPANGFSAEGLGTIVASALRVR